MGIVLDILIFVFAFILILWGGDRFVDSSVAIAKKIKIPTVLIGATLTSIGTTLPELLVTIFSATGSASGMAVGNSLGSIIFNSCIIGGILLCFMTVKTKKKTSYGYFILLFLVIITALMSINKKISIFESIILLVVFLVFMIVNYIQAKRASENKVEIAEVYTKKMWQYFLMFLISAGAIAVGAFFMVEKAKLFCSLAGLSETFVGLAILSFGTSLPELITTISAIKKKEANLGIGNIVGSNVINCSLLLGLTGVINANTGLGISLETLVVTLPVALIATFLLFVPTLIYKQTYKWQGICLISIYAVYYIYLILTGLGVIRIFS